MTGAKAPALVSTEWLATHVEDPGLRVADVRWYLPHLGKRGGEEYAQGHIPGAVFVDLERDLANPAGSGPGRHPLPSAPNFQEAMARAGVGPQTHVVAYDDFGGAIAARLWWLLRSFGHPRVSVLDGGIPRWILEGRAVEGGAASPVRSAEAFVARTQPGWVVDREAVRRWSRDPRALVLDARAAERYEGRVEPVDPRAGHVPGARSAPFAENMLDEPAPRMLPRAALRERYQRLGAAGATPVVAYCGSGVTACHTLLALHLAGLPDGLLYEGSWSDWSSDPTLPAATGPAPG